MVGGDGRRGWWEGTHDAGEGARGRSGMEEEGAGGVQQPQLSAVGHQLANARADLL